MNITDRFMKHGEKSHASTDEKELIAVIMAAIVAAEGGKVSIPELVIKRIKRIGAQQPTWSKAGLEDSMRSRRMAN